MKQFIIPVSFSNQPSFLELLGKAEEEFGFSYPMGALTIPYTEDIFINPTSRLNWSWCCYKRSYITILWILVHFIFWQYLRSDGNCYPCERLLIEINQVFLKFVYDECNVIIFKQYYILFLFGFQNVVLLPFHWNGMTLLWYKNLQAGMFR